MAKTISDKELLSLWKNINFAGSFRGAKTFQTLLKTDLDIDVSEKRILKVLKTDPIFLIHARPNRNIVRRQFDLNYYGELFQSDLGFVHESNGFKLFLVLIDCYSLKTHAIPLKDKNSTTVLNAFKELLKKFNCEITKLETDQGTEFSSVKKYCKEQNIIFKFKFGKNKARFRLSLVKSL